MTGRFSNRMQIWLSFFSFLKPSPGSGERRSRGILIRWANLGPCINLLGCHNKVQQSGDVIKNRNILFYNSGGQKSKKVSVGLVPYEGGEGESVPCLCLAFGGLLTIFGIPWLVDFSLYVGSRGILPVWASVPTLLQDVFILTDYLHNHPIST